jgi:hypothetical protein
VPLLVTALVIVAVIAVVWLILRARRTTDGVAGFRREIDALSSDARRPTIEPRLTDGEVDDDPDRADGSDRAVGSDRADDWGPGGPSDVCGGTRRSIDPGLPDRAEDDPDGS